MAPLSFVVHLSSEDSINLYPGNTAFSFQVGLPYMLNFPGKWTCAVEGLFVSYQTGFTCKCIHLMMDAIYPSIMYGYEKRVLATYPVPKPISAISSNMTCIGLGTGRIEKKTVASLKIDILTDTFQHCTNLTGRTILIVRLSNQEWETNTPRER